VVVHEADRLLEPERDQDPDDDDADLAQELGTPSSASI
jgi:hypothetical protein